MSDDDARGGYPVRVPHPEHNGRTPEDWENSALPTDLGAVQADDALLDALGGPRPPSDGPDAQLAQVLVAWRREIDTEPIRQLVDVDTALAMVARARRPVRRRSPVLVPFAAAAAMLVIALSGVSLGARTAAEPDDPLWKVTTVLYPEYARSVEATIDIRRKLENASNDLKAGRTDDAATELQKVEQQLAVVADEEDRAELEADRKKLKEQLASRSGPGSPTTAATSSPAAPRPAAPAAPATSTQPAATTTAETPPPPVENPPSPPPATEPPPPAPSSGSDPGAGGAGASDPTLRSDPPPGAAPPPAPAGLANPAETQ